MCVGVLEVSWREQWVNAVFREHFMCVGVFGDPRIWVWSKMVKSHFLGPAMPRTAKINDFDETFWPF